MSRLLAARSELHAVMIVAALACSAVPRSCDSSDLNAAMASFETPQSDAVENPSIPGRPFLISGYSMAVLLAMGGAAVMAGTAIEDERMRSAIDGSVFDPAMDAGDVFGNGITAGVGAAGLYAAGGLFGSRRLSATGVDLTRSLVLTWGSVWALKLLVDSDRPSGGDYSFPSGHAATAFAVAPVLTGHFGWKVGVPAYALATATAFARVEEGKHRMADVLVGAALGLVIGSEVSSRAGLGAIREHVAVRGRGLGVKVNF